MTSVLSTLNPLFEKNQTLTKSIYTSFNRSTREGVKKDSVNTLVNTNETESLHFNNDNLVFDSTVSNSVVMITPNGDITTNGSINAGGLINGVCTSATKAVNADHATNADQSDTAKALTDSGKTALQNDFDSRYVLQTAITDPNSMQMLAYAEQTILGTTSTAKLSKESVVLLDNFTIESYPSTSEDPKTILGVFEFFRVKLEVRGTGDSYVQTVCGKGDGAQGIVSLFLRPQGVQDKPVIDIPLRIAISDINPGKNNSAYVILNGSGSRFDTQYIDGETFSLYYYSSNYTSSDMTWKPTLYYRRVILYK